MKDRECNSLKGPPGLLVAPVGTAIEFDSLPSITVGFSGVVDTVCLSCGWCMVAAIGPSTFVVSCRSCVPFELAVERCSGCVGAGDLSEVAKCEPPTGFGTVDGTGPSFTAFPDVSYLFSAGESTSL